VRTVPGGVEPSSSQSVRAFHRTLRGILGAASSPALSYRRISRVKRAVPCITPPVHETEGEPSSSPSALRPGNFHLPLPLSDAPTGLSQRASARPAGDSVRSHGPPSGGCSCHGRRSIRGRKGYRILARANFALREERRGADADAGNPPVSARRPPSVRGQAPGVPRAFSGAGASTASHLRPVALLLM
jgi:hypothetical protein